MIKFIELHAKDAEWKEVYKTIVETCVQEVTAKKDETQKVLGVTKDVCNGIYHEFEYCVEHFEFYVSHIQSSCDQMKINVDLSVVPRKICC